MKQQQQKTYMLVKGNLLQTRWKIIWHSLINSNTHTQTHPSIKHFYFYFKDYFLLLSLNYS